MAKTIGGTETGMARVVDGVKLASGLYLADITDAVGVAAFDYRTGAVPEFTFDAVDRDRKLSARGLLREGTTLKYEADTWQIAAVERTYKGADIWLTFTARSRLARRLRNMTGPKTWEKATPEQVISSLVKKAGGTAVVEPGAGRMRIRQSRNQSVLDLIGSIASDTGVEWVEVDGVIYVGTPWWAWKDDATGLPTWTARVDGVLPDIGAGRELAVLDFNSRSSLDDRKNAAEAQLTVEVKQGSRVRPWNLVTIRKADDADNGSWLVNGVGFDEVSGSASIDLLRPLKSSPKKASQGESRTTDSGLGTALEDVNLEPLKNSSYKDAPIPANWGGRSVKRILAEYKAHINGYPGHSIYNGCLFYAQEVAGYPHIGRNPHALWPQISTAKRGMGRTVVPGAVLLFRNSNIGHAAVYLGGGLTLSTDMDANGNYTVGKWSIAPSDACERSFGTLLGWYAP